MSPDKLHQVHQFLSYFTSSSPTSKEVAVLEGDSTDDKLDALFMRGEPGDFITCVVAMAIASKADMGVSKNKLGTLIRKRFGVKSKLHRICNGVGVVKCYFGLKVVPSRIPPS
jgi:hypothetical protein